MERARAVTLPLLVMLASSLCVAGCAKPQPPSVSIGTAQLTRPAPADLESPKSAVVSYLDWTSYAYLVGNSDVASTTMSAKEEVRVDSYVQLNKEQQRRISQVLVTFKPRAANIEGTRATLGADESWEYRYLSADGSRAISETYTASYETTYNVVLIRPKTWIVDSVEARALGEVK